jgi:hypothetical protein
LGREEGEEADGDRERDGSSATGPAEAAASSSKASGQWESVRWARSTRPTAVEEEMKMVLAVERGSGG